jgi:hypothetical protein
MGWQGGANGEEFGWFQQEVQHRDGPSRAGEGSRKAGWAGNGT